MADQKVSLLINRQVPEFIREEYPVFISFLEAYYEFLEQKQGTQKNDLTTKAKELRDIPDVDISMTEFETQFFNTFASLIPKDVEVDKSVLIKKLLPLYLAKGSEASFKLLYRMMFGGELEVKYPGNNILRASDGKWEIENALKISSNIYSYYTGDGETFQFKILESYKVLTEQDLAVCVCGRSPSGYCVGLHNLTESEYLALQAQINATAESLVSSFTVYVDGVFQVPTINYYVRKESNKIVFLDVPADGAEITIGYSDLDISAFTNRKVTGETSGATALVEKVSKKVVAGELINEFYINDKTLDGDFVNGETVYFDVFVDGVLVNVAAETISNVQKINILDGGASYNVGDPVVINTPSAEILPTAIISKIFKGVINQVTPIDGGAGFMVGERVAAVGYDALQLDFSIGGVNTTGANTVSSFKIFSDVISDIDPANTTLDVASWYFPGNIAPSSTVNVNSVISTAFANTVYYSIGEISNVTIVKSEISITSTPVLNAAPAYVSIEPLTANTTSNTVVTIDTFGSLGKIIIENGGQDYVVGDELTFTNKPMCFGTGAAAVVSDVSALGRITGVRWMPSKVVGTANVTSVSNVMVAGTGTSFLTDFVAGDDIMIGFDTRKVVVVNSDTSLNVDSYFSEIYIDKPIRKWGKDLIGGQNYKQDKLPTVGVTSTSGTGADIVVTCILGDGENLDAKGTKRPGEIEEISITNPGRAIRVVPSIDLSGYGDGTATANITLNPSYETFEGRWTTSDGIISSVDRKLQGRDYYVNYSYLLSSTTEFAKYKKIFNELLHPSGFKAYAELQKLDVLDTNVLTLNTITAPKNIKSVSGRVNVANASIYVTGQGTKFNVANSLGIITVGSYIAVNSEIRVVSNIISNTNIAVTSAFTITANNEELVVVNTVYDAVATEITLDEIIAENELTLTVES